MARFKVKEQPEHAEILPRKQGRTRLSLFFAPETGPNTLEFVPSPTGGRGLGRGCFLNAFEIVARKNASDFFHHPRRRFGFNLEKAVEHA
jgi:hypothetical protein